MKLIESKTLSSAQASIEFTNIPQDGTDLFAVFSMRGANSNVFDQVLMRINGSTSTYTIRGLAGSGSTAFVDGTTGLTGMKIGAGVGATATANTFCNGEVYIPNYTGSNQKIANATDVGENNATETYQFVYASRWSGTSAITSLLFFSQNATNWVAGSTISLYKITKGSDGIVTTS